MKITAALIDKLIRLRDGESLPSSCLKGAWVNQLLEEGVLISRSHGRRSTLSVANKELFLMALSRLQEGLEDLDSTKAMIACKDSACGVPLRAMQAARTGNSKMFGTRTFPGFLVNSYEPIECLLHGKPFTTNPPEGTAVFISDWQELYIPDDIVVVGVENGENFRFIRQQRELFETAIGKGVPLLFVTRYPDSADLRAWLKSIPNRYVHFGDMDLAGISIYQNEFYRHLGERASMLLPYDFERRIMNGSSKRYLDQEPDFGNLKILDPRIQPLAACIRKYHRCYDQEGWIL